MERNFLHFVRLALTALAVFSTVLFSLSASAQAGLVRWGFEPAIAPTAWIAGETISVGYTVTSSGQTDAADLVADIRIKRNDDQAFQQAGNFKVCVGFDGVCSTILAQFSVNSGQTIVSIAGVVVSPSSDRAGRQLWVRRLVADNVNVEDANVRSAFLDIAPSLPNGPDTIAGCRLDIDGDGEVRRETDGLLIQRFLSGYRGEALISNALATRATRKTAVAILNQLETQNFQITASPARSTNAGLIFGRYFSGVRNTALSAGVSGAESANVQKLIETTLSFTNGIDECALPLIGIRTIDGLPKTSDVLALVTGGTAIKILRIRPTTGFVADDFSMQIEGGSGFATVLKSDGMWSLTVSTPRAPTTQEKFIRVRITNLKTGASAVKVLTISVVAPAFVSTGQINAAGGLLPTSTGGAISFSSNTLPATIPSSVQETSATSARTRVSIQFGSDVRGRGILMTIPTPPSTSPSSSSKAVSANSNATCDGTPSATFSTSQLLEPHASNRSTDCGIGYVWRKQPACFTDWGDHRIPFDRPIKVDSFFHIDEAVAVGSNGKTLELDCVAEASRLSATFPLPSQPVDIGGREPVLFVHGFGISPTTASLGGGLGTWRMFPRLVQGYQKPNGNGFIAFEFQWATDARFIDVAGDLVKAIKLINNRTGKSVHIVAHSFGGVLVRTLLQGLAYGVTTNESSEARSAVASLVTLGSPHSGIADYSGKGAPNSSTTLPKGQDSASFESCDQISCNDMGEAFSGWNNNSFVGRVRDIVGVADREGEHAARIADTISQLPQIPVIVGIGLTNDRGIGNNVWDAGDYLISYEGQRLHPADSANQTTAPLRKATSVGQATVYEVILGSKRDVKPGVALNQEELASSNRRLGYLHSSDTGGMNFCAIGGMANVACDYDGGGFGIEAAVGSECLSGSADCKHAGWLLFKSLQLGRFCEFTEAGCPVPASTKGRIANTGWHTCALVSGGEVRCWGSNSNGQVGLSPASVVSSPATTVAGLASVIAVSNGVRHSCALISDGTVKCWGDNNAGQLGNGSTTPSFTPVSVQGLPGPVSRISAGYEHTCAIIGDALTGGVVKCWGSNSNGQLGPGLPSGVKALASGAWHTCALLVDGTVRCWGVVAYVPFYASNPVDTGVVYTDIFAGAYHACGITSQRTVRCWGDNRLRQIGPASLGSGETGPTEVAGLPADAASGAAGYTHSCARMTSGDVWCWGANDKGESGISNTTNPVVPPVRVGDAGAYLELAAGVRMSCGIRVTGQVDCWGENDRGQLGLGTGDSAQHPVPTNVPGVAVSLP